MRGHLSDAELTDGLGGELAETARAHLDACATCRAEWDRLRGLVADLAKTLRRCADRPPFAWERQRQQIIGQLEPRRPTVWSGRWAWGTAVVALAVVGSVWLQTRTSHPPGTETDHALLVAVGRSVQAEFPAALRPVALLAAELERVTPDARPGADASQGDGQ